MGFKVANLVVFHGVADFDRLAADFAVFDVGLASHGGIQHY